MAVPDSPSAVTGAPSAPPQASAPPAPPAPAESAPATDLGTYEDDQYSREQLIQHARTLVGAEPFVVEVALRHAGGQDHFTQDEAKAAVKELMSAPAGGE